MSVQSSISISAPNSFRGTHTMCYAFWGREMQGTLIHQCVYLHEFSTKDSNSRRFMNFQNFFEEISKKKQEMFNRVENECSITHLDFFTQLLSWHPHYVLCLLRQRNAWDTYSLVCIYMSFQLKIEKRRRFKNFQNFFKKFRRKSK